MAESQTDSSTGLKHESNYTNLAFDKDEHGYDRVTSNPSEKRLEGTTSRGLCNKRAILLVSSLIFIAVVVAVVVTVVIVKRDKDAVSSLEGIQWGGWSECSTTCGTGVRQRSRLCGSIESSGCSQSFQQTEECVVRNCADLGPDEDKWLPWGSWTECSVTCGSGTNKRYRSCGTDKCNGNYVEAGICSRQACPVFGRWATWTSWGSCDVSCGGGVQTRFRTCFKTVENDLNCIGNNTQEKECSLWKCPDCSQTCDVGTLNKACDACICEGTLIKGRVLAHDTRFPISNAGLYAASAPTTLLARSDSVGNFILNATCLTTNLFLSRAGFQDSTVEIVTSYQEITLKKVVLPYLTQTPQSKRRLIGENVTFCCQAIAEPNVTYYEWLKDSVMLDSSNNSIITIVSVGLLDQGNYQCRANSPAGAVMSPAARLEVKENPEAFCADALRQKTIVLPDDCIQTDTNTAAFEVGECIAKACRRNGSSDSFCQDEVRSCCSIAEADLKQVQCSGYELEVVVVRSCGCADCTSNNITISGYALAFDNRDPVKLAEVWVDGQFQSYTAFDGRFTFDLKKRAQKVTVNIQDNYFRLFLPAVKYVTLTDAMSGTLNIDVLMIRTAEPVLIDSTVENTLVAGGSSGDAKSPVVQMSISPYTFYQLNGSQYTGNVRASLTFLDPTNSSVLQNMPGIFEFVDEEGQIGNLASLGVFNIDLSDETGEPLVLDEVIDLSLSADIDVEDKEISYGNLTLLVEFGNMLSQAPA